MVRKRSSYKRYKRYNNKRKSSKKYSKKYSKRTQIRSRRKHGGNGNVTNLSRKISDVCVKSYVVIMMLMLMLMTITERMENCTEEVAGVINLQ